MTKNAAPKLPSLTKEDEIKAKIRDFANSFLEEKISSVDFKRICEGEFDTKDLSEKKELSELRKTELQQIISDKLKDENLSPKAFKKCVKLAIFVNDEFLNQVLKQKPKLIKKIEDHGKILNIAEEFKSTETFKILIENGFDPQKKDKKTLSIFALAAQNQGAAILSKKAIAEIPAYQTTDIHEICREGNLKNFEDFARRIFLKQTGFFKLINTVDQKGKTPLFYALDGNCYSELVEKLVDFRADPNFLRNNCEPDEANDALTLCAQKKEPRTLGVILKSQGAEITSKSLHNCAKALCDSENLNAETIRYFFKNVKREDLKKIESDEIFFEELVGNGIYFAPTETSKKIKDLDPEKINKVLYKAIQRSSSEIVKNFLQNFDIVNSNRTEDDYNERSCLIKSNNSSHKSYGSSQGKINPSKKTKDSTKPKLIFNFDSFFDVATGSLKYRLKDSESESPAESKEVLILLLKAGIQPSDKNRMTRNLEELGIKKEDYESSKSCYAVFCSAISSVFLSNNGRTN
jgi:hypothetical protein